MIRPGACCATLDGVGPVVKIFANSKYLQL